MKKLFFLLFASTLLLAGCDPKEPVTTNDASLRVTPEHSQTGALQFSAEATESFTFAVETNQSEWDAVADQTWVVVTKADDGNSFTVTAQPNTETTAPADAVITVTAGEATPVTIDAKQDAFEPQAVTKYTVTVTDDGNGTAQADVEEAEEGDEVTLTATPAEGYLFKQWTVESGSVTFDEASANPATFTMPAENVSIKAEFIEDLPYVTLTTGVGDGGSFNWFFAGEGEAFIDWGDGTPIETITLKPLDSSGRTNETDHSVPHAYAAGSGVKTIIVKGHLTGMCTGFMGWATDLDASHMPTLEYLECRMEVLTSLNVKGCVALKKLLCYRNQLTELDITDCVNLIEVRAAYNFLTELDVTNQTSVLDLVSIEANDFGKDALIKIFNDLPDRSGQTPALPEGCLYCGGYGPVNPGYADARETGWAVCGPKNWWPYDASM